MCILHPHAAHAVLREMSDFQKTNIGLLLFVHWVDLWAFSIWEEFKKLRVEAANPLYQWIVEMILQLHARNVDWSIENPASWLLWITDPFLHFQSLVPTLHAVSFHTCMFLAPRKKTTAIWASFSEIVSLRRTCDGSHQHLQWGLAQSGTGFATAEECAYNDNLASAWAEAFWCRAQTRNVVSEPKTFDEVTDEQMMQIKITNKAMVGLLPRGRLINDPWFYTTSTVLHFSKSTAAKDPSWCPCSK